MRYYTSYLTLHTEKKKEFVNITQAVKQAVAKSGVQEGMCLVNSMHITASVFINDEESGLKEDFLVWLEKLAPSGAYKHHATGEDNAPAHLQRTLMGREVMIAITDGRLDFGPWEQVFYGEFDGQRDKKVVVKIIGE